MNAASDLPAAITRACHDPTSPYNTGVSIGRLLYNIEFLVNQHLEHPISYHLPTPHSLDWAPDFVHAVSVWTAHLRNANNLTTALVRLPHGIYDRKGRSKQRKCIAKHVQLVETHYKACVREVLGEVFAGWNPVKTQDFNKGVDKALNRTRWRIYPLGNVVMEVGEGDWGEWLRIRCEEVNWREMVEGGSPWEMCDER